MRLRFAFYGLRMTRSTPDQVAPLMAFGEKLMRDERREGLQRFGNALVFL